MASTSNQPPAPANVITNVNQSLTNLRETLESLTQGSMQDLKRDAEEHFNQELRGVAQQLKASKEKQAAEVEEINELIRQVFEEELVASFAQIVEAGVLENIDDLVQEQVREQLPLQLPEALQEEMRSHKEELARLEAELHNSESIAHNSTLPMNPALKLFPLVTPNGVVSEKFPVTLGQLFDMTEQDAVWLLHEYGHTDAIVSNSRERNVNEVMRLCGVQYYLASRSGISASRSPTSPSTNGGNT
ncbi:uncharacterized protein TRAVEDRAFT_51694 [Trametes versicolor FP-101664 SS1]|uniref:uncharacterized protein n=1 Tax=Trametes versicolor (strain FP-101664) TaxID=717944 RepID=UPI0004624502|nr:uncharacterized protein TRAVEDRAFT_51694 [Trametes versicolor FP-101664 SS1]EIW53956.1 hypothetical protein TRAVEDRAFT_51694 [Trametes versicolor FP-101664 SS1]